MMRKLSEILVEREQNSVLTDRPCENVGIGTARGIGSNPGDVVPTGRKITHSISRKVLIREKAHRFLSRASGLERKDLLLPENFACISQACHDVVVIHRRIVFFDVRFRPTLPEQAENEVNCQAGSSNNRLARENSGVSDDAVVSVHSESRITQRIVRRDRW